MIEVFGTAEVLARFAAMAAASEPALIVGQTVLADNVAESARGMAPVDTGALRDSIEASPDGVTVGVDYAIYVEYGTVNMPPEPFLRPAADTADLTSPAEAAAAVLKVV